MIADPTPYASTTRVTGYHALVLSTLPAIDAHGILSAVTSMDIAVSGSPNYGTWSTLSPTGTGPGAIAEHASAYDPDGDRILVFGGVYQSGNSRNELWALDFADADVTAPSAVIYVAFNGVTPVSATIRWTAPGDNGATGTAVRYDIRTSLSPITAANFASATQHTCVPSPASAGTLQTTVIGGLQSGNTYYFAMKTLDDHWNISPISNGINICIPYTPGTLCDDFKISPPGGELDEPTKFGSEDLGSQLASSPVHVSFGLSRSGPVTIETVDIMGRRVARTDFGDLEPGAHNLTLATGSRLAAGLYVVRLQQGVNT